MGRRQDHQHHDSTVVNSSIALLQERFRQLEKVKERREGKELLKLFSSSSSSDSSSSSSAVQFQAEASQQPSLLVHNGSLSLGLHHQTNRQAHHHNTIPSPSNLWPQQAASSASSSFEHYSDVDHIDTSLHL